MPDVLDSGKLFADGELVRVIELDQADVGPITALHIPAIDAVIAGDAVYNEIHLMLGASSPAEWSNWIDSGRRVSMDRVNWSRICRNDSLIAKTSPG